MREKKEREKRRKGEKRKKLGENEKKRITNYFILTKNRANYSQLRDRNTVQIFKIVKLKI